jgi:TPP-dependent pyruvate/acetoin dehydrogenase alpha subunit
VSLFILNQKLIPLLPWTGMAVGRDLKKKDNHVIAVIGDGAVSRAFHSTW